MTGRRNRRLPVDLRPPHPAAPGKLRPGRAIADVEATGRRQGGVDVAIPRVVDRLRDLAAGLRSQRPHVAVTSPRGDIPFIPQGK